MPNFIVSPVVVVPTQRRNQTSVTVVVHVDVARGHSLALTSSVVAWAFRWNRGAADFCAWWGNFWCDTSDDKTRTHTTCLTVRVCLGSDVWGSSSTRRYDDNTGIPGAHLCPRSSEEAFARAWLNRTTMMVAMMEMAENLLKVVQNGFGREKLIYFNIDIDFKWKFCI